MNAPSTMIQSVFALRRQLSRRMAARLKNRSPYTYRQLGLLKLVGAGEVSTQSEAADRLGIDPPAVSRLVDVLEREGLLVRAEGKDRRSGRLHITPLGRTHSAPIHEALEEAEKELEEILGAHDSATLKRLIHGLLTALEDAPAKERAHG